MSANRTLELASGIHDIARDTWDALANPAGDPFDPFLSWGFLAALEESGCATEQTGWAPHHAVLREECGEIAAVAPLYVKGHSFGEFVFDHAWADAYERAGGSYYPKLLAAVPFTPATGRRLLAGAGPDADQRRDQLAAGLAQITERVGVSSLHLNFLAERDRAMLERLGYMMRQGQQFHWINRGYESFDDFLAALSSRKRKDLRKERARAQDGLTIHRLSGDDLRPEHWDAFFEFYLDTGARKWGQPYLNRDFFDLLHDRMKDRIVLIMAEDDSEWIAGAMNLMGSETLYGRYWGRAEERPFLHFELCYYQAIDAAIERGLSRVEAGAQGAHKLARGYEPVATWSAHWIPNPGFRDAVSHYLEHERAAVSEEIAELTGHMPFRKTVGNE